MQEEVLERLASGAELVSVRPAGQERWRIVTPFEFDDGDGLVVVLKRDAGRWVLTDEGHTFMRLGYELAERDVSSGLRRRAINEALSSHQVTEEAGRLFVRVEAGNVVDRLARLAQTIMQIYDVRVLRREVVRTTFFDDAHGLFDSFLGQDQVHHNWHHHDHDPYGRYAVDVLVTASKPPIAVYLLANSDQVRDANVSLLQLKQWGIRHHTVGIFEQMGEISRPVLARFTDAVDKQFSTLRGNQDRIQQYLDERLAA